MVGTTLVELRSQIEALASDEGRYYLVCARTGERPVPADGKRFLGRTAARQAARATEHYRATLRRYDPRVPCYDVIVCEATEGVPDSTSPRDEAAETDWSLTEPAVADGTPAGDRRDRIEFCHTVAATVFESLSAAGYDVVERTVMDVYFDLAETVTDPDDLCLRLLESIATELDAALTPAEQADVLDAAVERLPSPDATVSPVAATLDHLEALGMLGLATGERSTCTDEAADGRSVTIRLTDYALSAHHGRLSVLPVVLEYYRRQHQPPTTVRVVALDDGWRLTLGFASETEPDGLATASIQTEPP